MSKRGSRREGLLQWSQACFEQATRTYAASSAHLKSLKSRPQDPEVTAELGRHLQTQCHFFAVAACKLLDFRAWADRLGLCGTVDFAEIDRFDRKHIRDIRNMREHAVEYFEIRGFARDRWIFNTALYAADASSVCGVMIGGRLDYMAFGAAASRLHTRLREPAPVEPAGTGP